MNAVIETLNRFGGNALYFAWPMLWQSSALIVILFAADFALRRRIRAAVRYALWLVLLVKLLLPPSLALPTGVAWWLMPAAASAKPHTTKFVVSYDANALPSLPLQPAPAFTPPSRPPMSVAAWAILAWSAISAGLLGWLTVRWRQVVSDVQHAMPVSAWLNELFDDAKSSTGLRRNVHLRLTDQAMSPAVCGLFRPVIILPQSLVQKLTPEQLWAVLLHELTHLRRGDVWMNCAQALVQIVYWWHPLLWLANARIRRVREEAVDDAVMLALRDEAETYAPTLLEVAKLAFHRPPASLGLVGILESRSDLGQRIERLINFQAPRKAGLTLLSLCGICIFSAVAVPMGEALPPSTDATHVDQKESAADKAIEAARLVQDAKVDYEMGKFDGAERLLTSALGLNPDNQTAHYYRDLVEKARHATKPPQGPKIIYPGWAGTPTNLNANTRIFVIKNRHDIVNMLDEIRLNNVEYDGTSLNEAAAGLFSVVAEHNPERKSIEFLVDSTHLSGEATGVGAVTITIKPPLASVRLRDLLDAIVRGADKPIKYSIEDYGVVFSSKEQMSAPLFTRTFTVNTNVFLANLQRQTGLKTNVSAAFRQILSNAGVDTSPPKSIYYNETRGVLFLYATEPDLDAAEKAVMALNYSPTQIHIKARFIEVPEEEVRSLRGYFMSTGTTNVAGVLTDPNLRLVNHALEQFQALEQEKGVEYLGEPEVTTTSGRQTQMRVTTTLTIITNFIFRETSTNSAITPQEGQVECGPFVDTVASILPDGYTIDLRTMASVTEFLGYDNPPTNSTPMVTSKGAIVRVPTILPSFRVRQANAHLKLWDGQTVVLGKLPQHFYDGGKGLDTEPDYFRIAKRTRNQPGTVNKELLVFITVTLVDPAGNRIHSDDEIAQKQQTVAESALNRWFNLTP